GGYIIGIGSKKHEVYDFYIEVPNFKQANPLLMIIPIQLLAYYLSVERNCNPDKPKNLAKSVTVR
ncbi:MAG: glutamine--fructose-6-phosphate transaminase (isomerizing), partial [Candidatus Nanoarchaeia archaeon]|nr:glutamine--fructose-6-phosphate transaminase (isomerizing) [Candidatus Nanoarchaeia archaeon]